MSEAHRTTWRDGGASIPTRAEVEQAWQAVLTLTATRDQVHDWAAGYISRRDIPYSDLTVSSGLESLYRLNATLYEGELTEDEVKRRHLDWVSHCRAWDVHSDTVHRFPEVDVARAAWGKQWGSASAQGWRVRGDVPQHWVRFHTLPGSKRYPETMGQWDEVLRRHHTLLDALRTTTPTAPWFVSVPTYEWPGEPLGRAPEIDASLVGLGPAREWQTYEPDDYDDTARHLWLYQVNSGDFESLDLLLKAVADSTVPDVVIGPRDWSWVYVPYDGGADVIAGETERNQLMAAHADWMAPGPYGL